MKEKKRLSPRTLRHILVTVLVLVLSIGLAVPVGASHSETDAHTDNIRVVDRDAFPYASDLAFQGSTMVAGAGAWDGYEGYEKGVYLYGMRGNGQIERAGASGCKSWHSDVDIMGKYVVQSHDSGADNRGCFPGEGQEGVRVIDISNKKDPRSVGFAETIHGSHNLTAVGDTGLVYVASYNLRDPADVDGVSIVDVAADPEDPPVSFLEFPDADKSQQHPDMKNSSGDVPTSMGCHDIGLDLEKNLAFCAGITETMIWDISDPREPEIIEIIKNPGISIHHGAQVNADGDTLVIDDEWLGAAGANTGCLAPKQPSGALWFYDISNPRSPKPLSYWSPPKPAPTDDFCTSHFFGTFPDRDWLVTSWYDHGIYVVDFSDPAAPKEVANYDPKGATFWAAYPYRGYLYASDFAPATLTGHGTDNAGAGGAWVFELDGYSPEGPGPKNPDPRR